SAFTPGVVEGMRTWASAAVDGALDAAAERGHLDVVDELAYPVPQAVIGRLLGLPAADAPRLRNWSRVLMPSADPLTLHDPDLMAAYRAAEEELLAHLAGVVAERRARPADDLVSGLVGAGGLSEPELLTMLELLLVAGFETTAAMIGNSVL